MNKRLVKIALIVVLIPVVAVVGYMGFSSYNKFRAFQQYYVDATKVIQEIARINTDVSEENLKADMDEWNRKANEKLEAFYGKYSGSEIQAITNSVEYTQALLRDVFALRLDYTDAIEPLYSERMQDHQTIREEVEYNWRMKTLEEISRYITNYDDKLIDSVDAFRESVAGSNWSDQYREYAWQDWGRDIKPQLIKMLPDISGAESKIAKYQRFFALMYNNREFYYVNEKGEFVFSNQRYLNDCLSTINTMESSWRKYTVFNPMN
ncbi:MAG: hypothetical protein JXA04_00700 [Gammaproteobacteria bacterium]|nr:hypothetical protein [Gammaproteobacteria bacterium]